jgi:hypothetical protein
MSIQLLQPSAPKSSGLLEIDPAAWGAGAAGGDPGAAARGGAARGGGPGQTYDAFGLVGTTFRELGWKTRMYFERAAPISPNAS